MPVRLQFVCRQLAVACCFFFLPRFWFCWACYFGVNCGVWRNVKACENRGTAQGVAAMADTERERMVVEERAPHLDLPSARGFNAGAPDATDYSKPLVYDSPKLLTCETSKDKVFLDFADGASGHVFIFYMFCLD